MLFTVYDERGEVFEVAPHIAKHLIIELGWTISPPKVKVEKTEETLKDE
jgi:hypothetical protein